MLNKEKISEILCDENIDFFPLEKMNIGVGGEEGKKPDTVYMYFDEIGGQPIGAKLAVFWDKPKELRKFIEDLIGYYNLLWSKAEPINSNAEIGSRNVNINKLSDT